MNLTARREPTFDGAGPGGTFGGGHHGAPAAAALHAVGAPSRFTRFVSSLQIAGTLIGVPLGLASGYSIYRANFSVETSCQGLRGNIVAMLDKNVDAATRRMLVRRDVATFEQNCGGVDPDAHAAFKRLLAAEAPVPGSVTVAAKAKTEIKAETKPDTAARPTQAVRKIDKADKPELRPAVADKETVKTAASTAAEAEPREAGLSDTRWLAAVRQALVAHGPERATEPVVTFKPKPTHAELHEPGKAPVAALHPAWAVAPPPMAAPPAPAVVMTAPPLNADRPVPPAPIPAVTNDDARPSSWIAHIPFIGQVIERAAN